jgi:hypothetical protein
VPNHVFARLLANVAIEGAAGTIPLVGDLFDADFRDDRRNVKTLRDYFVQQGLL